MLIQQTINGLALGSVYALIAVGFSLVFSVLYIINFSHGGIYMIGVYIALTLITGLGWSFGAALPATMAACALLGIVAERLVIYPLRKKRAPRVLSLVGTLGVATTLSAAAELIWGAEVKGFPSPFPAVSMNLFGARISVAEASLILIAAAAMALVQAFLKYTTAGKAVRATSQNPEAAALMGINVDGVIRTVFAVGSAIGALGGMLIGAYYSYAQPSMGFEAGMKGFVSAILGGIGSVAGAGLGGLVLGLLEVLGGAYISFAYRDAISFGALVITLLARPAGLLGLGVKEKV